jgi:Sulfotransferase family
MKKVAQTPRWKLHLFWYLSYSYFQNDHFFNYILSKIKTLLSRLEDSRYKNRWKNIEIKKPIFIIGPHRSGTTILQQALCLHSAIATPRSYSDILDMSPILSQRVVRPLMPGLSDRIVDRIIVGSDTPQEAQGLMSRYFDRDSVSYDPISSEGLRNYMRKLLYLEEKTRFLWKAPYVTNHVPEMASEFPDSQFIYIHRDPVTCVDSKLKFIKIWQEQAQPPLFLYRNLVGKHQNFGQTGMGYFMEQANRTVNLQSVQLDSVSMTGDHMQWIENALRDLATLNSSKRCCFLSYETLVDEPKESLGRIFEFLQLPDESDDIIVKMDEIGMPFRKTNPHHNHISEDDLPAIRERCGSHLQEISSGINWDNFFVIGPRSLF